MKEAEVLDAVEDEMLQDLEVVVEEIFIDDVASGTNEEDVSKASTKQGHVSISSWSGYQ